MTRWLSLTPHLTIGAQGTSKETNLSKAMQMALGAQYCTSPSPAHMVNIKGNFYDHFSFSIVANAQVLWLPV